LQQALQGTYLEDLLDSERIRVYGWVNGAANVSTRQNLLLAGVDVTVRF
jgi:hypothetical protein